MSKYEYSNEIVHAIKQFLTDDDWNYSFNEETGIFRFGLKIKSKIQNISYVIDVHEDEFITYGMCPIGADQEDPEMMARMAEFICRANYGLKNGCFELDFNDGEIRFRSFVDCENLLPSENVIKNSVHCTAAMFERYAAGIVAIVFEGASAKEAVTKCEKTMESEIRSMVERAIEDVSEGDLGELLARLSRDSSILDVDDNGQEDEDRPEDIRLDPFADGAGSGSGEEGGDAS